VAKEIVLMGLETTLEVGMNPDERALVLEGAMSMTEENWKELDAMNMTVGETYMLFFRLMYVKLRALGYGVNTIKRQMRAAENENQRELKGSSG